MRLAICSTFDDLAQAVRRFHKDHRFLCAITRLDDSIALYGANTQAVDALIAAREDYPKGTVVGEYEYLSPETIKALRNPHSRDPIAQAMKHLGQTARDADHFELPRLNL